MSASRIDGVLLLDKHEGLSSNAALQKARRLFSSAKAGHTGTLDPLATGLLPLCFGQATKFSNQLLDANKTYEADILFGIKTSTGDREGEIIERADVGFSREALEAALKTFCGEIQQTPPMYSALKHDGQPLYRLARRGVTVRREKRAVMIYALELLDFAETRCRLRIACGKGTYIRVLAEDLGEALRCGAHLTALRRTTIGDFRINDALTLDDLGAMPTTERILRLKPIDVLLRDLPTLVVDAAKARRFLHGNAMAVEASFGVGRCRVYADGRFIGVGELGPDKILQPRHPVASAVCQ